MDKRIVFAILVSFLILAPMAFAAAQSKEPLEQVTILHYKKGFEKSQALPGKAQPVSCTKYLGKGLKWQTTPISLVINPNYAGLDATFITSTIMAGATEWDSHTGANLFGPYLIDNTANWDSTPDKRNELSFGNYSTANVIAVTRIWSSSLGKTKRIVEFDIMFDTDFAWGDASANPALMDLQNIATHEIGHGLGLADLYSTACYSQTMYGYSTEGDTDGRTLESGDIKGIQTLYGS
jgi:hypothetical protein